MHPSVLADTGILYVPVPGDRIALFTLRRKVTRDSGEVDSQKERLPWNLPFPLYFLLCFFSSACCFCSRSAAVMVSGAVRKSRKASVAVLARSRARFSPCLA